MADSYVCSGAMMKCSCGTNTSVLTVLPDRTVMLAGNPPMANITDIKTGTNIPSFGECATTIIPTPCTPLVTAPWQNGKMDYLVRNNPALLKSSTCICNRGGMISILDDGQKGESPGIEKQPKEVTPDEIVVVDAYWEFYYDGKKYKIRFTPFGKVNRLIVEFFYKYDNASHSKDNTTLILEVPDGVGEKGVRKEIQIPMPGDNPKQIGTYNTGNTAKNLYQFVINAFSSDLRYLS